MQIRLTLLMKDHLRIEVPMDKEDRTYRDVLSQAEQGMIDNGEYVLLDEQDQMVDMDAPLPEWSEEKAARRELPVFHLHPRPIALPKVWIGYYQDLKQVPLFCFLTGDATAAKELEGPIECFMDGGFAVVHFRDAGKLEQALDNPERLAQFDMVGLVADAIELKSLWDIRQRLIARGRCESKKMPFACACHCGPDERRRREGEQPVLENGIIPAPVDLSLADPSVGAEKFCEQMIYTLYYDEEWYLPLRDAREARVGQQVAVPSAVLKEAVRLQDEAFYAGAGEHYTNFLKRFAHEFKKGPGWPEPSLMRRLIASDKYFGRSNLIGYLENNMLGYFKKIIDLGKNAVAGLAIG